METIRDIRIRLKSINSTKQITESMRMISTRKVQKTKRRMQENRAYSEKSLKTIRDMVDDGRFGAHAYVAGHELNEGEETGKPLVIVITGDRGLCGGYNINAAKKAAEFGDADFVTVGTKGRDYFRRRERNIIAAYKGLSENPFYKDALTVGNIALKMYDEKTANEVHLVYTEYHSMLSQTPKALRLLPLELGAGAGTGKSAGRAGSEEEAADAAAVSPFIYNEEPKYETDADELFKSVALIHVYSKIFGAMLESAVCEQCSKLTSMDSAVKNSEKIIDALTLKYNQMRQSAITQEIAEIVGGANAVEK